MTKQTLPQNFTSVVDATLFGVRDYQSAKATIVWHIECLFQKDCISGIKIVPEKIDVETVFYKEDENGDRIEDKVTSETIDFIPFSISKSRDYQSAMKNYLSGKEEISIKSIEIDYSLLEILVLC